MYPTPITDNEQLEMASASSNVAGPRFGNVVVSDNSTALLPACFGALIAQERGAASVKILISSLTPDMLAELVIVNMQQIICPVLPLLFHQGLALR
jgi:hypothetical protein